MVISADSNGTELRRVVLRAQSRRGKQKTKNLGVGLRRPASQEVEQKKHQQAAEQTVEKVKRAGAQAQGEEEKSPLSPQDRQGPRERPMHSVDSSDGHRQVLLRKLRASVAGKQPREEIHRGDGHADAEQHASQQAFRAAFAKGKGKTGDDNGDER